MSAVSVKHLYVTLSSRNEAASIITDLSLNIASGKILGMVGESGCGKSTLALALCGLLPARTSLIEGSIKIGEEELVGMSPRKMRHIRGSKVAYIPQDPMAALNPTMTIGVQLMEAPREHLNLSRRDSRKLALELLDLVQLPSSEKFLRKYPHELSGGMRQRIMIAIAMSCKPILIVADEPTTALDVTVQAEILRLFRKITSESGTAVIFVSHDLGVVSQISDEIAVIYAGEIVEYGSREDVTQNPLHPYTYGLLSSVPELNDQGARWTAMPFIGGKPPDVYERPTGCRFAPRCSFRGIDDCESTHSELLEVVPNHWARTKHPIQSDLINLSTDQDQSYVEHSEANQTILHVSNLVKIYGAGALAHTAVDDVSFSISKGTTFGLIGESGSGKSSLASCILQLNGSYLGNIAFEGKDISQESTKNLRKLRRKMQVVFQDSHNSMNSKMTIGKLVGEPLEIFGSDTPDQIKVKVKKRLHAVGLNSQIMDRYPRQCSGGELQRACIARALILNPLLLICDEAVASLDVSNKAQILNLLREIQVAEGLTILFISHDFATINAVSDKIGVMKNGKMVEQGEPAQILLKPQHWYTKQLVASVPQLERHN